jgi:hypothetical protein
MEIQELTILHMLFTRNSFFYTNRLLMVMHKFQAKIPSYTCTHNGMSHGCYLRTQGWGIFSRANGHRVLERPAQRLIRMWNITQQLRMPDVVEEWLTSCSSNKPDIWTCYLKRWTQEDRGVLLYQRYPSLLTDMKHYLKETVLCTNFRRHFDSGQTGEE